MVGLSECTTFFFFFFFKPQDQQFKIYLQLKEIKESSLNLSLESTKCTKSSLFLVLAQKGETIACLSKM